MAGLKSNLKDLGKAFEQLKAMEAELSRRQALKQELRNAFIRQGYPFNMASILAEEKYKQIHKNK
jgi:hypothetical protein